MKYLSIDEVLAIHHELIREFGGSPSIRDFGLLYAATERPKATFSGKDLYPTLFHKAASLLHSLIFSHPFIDGNKRTAFVATARFLLINGYNLKVSQKELLDYLLSIQTKKIIITRIAIWMKDHVEKIN